MSLFVLGSALRTLVNICNVNPICDADGIHNVVIGELKIIHLRSLIWNLKEDDINKAVHLKLWKVEFLRDDKQLDKLNEMFHKGEDIENQP